MWDQAPSASQSRRSCPPEQAIAAGPFPSRRGVHAPPLTQPPSHPPHSQLPFTSAVHACRARGCLLHLSRSHSPSTSTTAAFAVYIHHSRNRRPHLPSTRVSVTPSVYIRRASNCRPHSPQSQCPSTPAVHIRHSHSRHAHLSRSQPAARLSLPNFRRRDQPPPPRSCVHRPESRAGFLRPPSGVVAGRVAS